MKLRGCKPGSMMPDGAVIDIHGKVHTSGPCWVPANFGYSRHDYSIKRRITLAQAGWRLTPVQDWPGIAPAAQLTCIHRVNP